MCNSFAFAGASKTVNKSEINEIKKAKGQAEKRKQESPVNQIESKTHGG